MKIQLLSDLHLEANPGFVPSPAPGADLLVLAGDIGSYQANSALTAAGDADFGLQRFSPLHGWPTPVLFVPGNHEYDGLDFDEAHQRLQATCARLGITWLEREVLHLNGGQYEGQPFKLLGWQDGKPPADPVGGSTSPIVARTARTRTLGPSSRSTVCSSTLITLAIRPPAVRPGPARQTCKTVRRCAPWSPGSRTSWARSTSS